MWKTLLWILPYMNTWWYYVKKCGKAGRRLEGRKMKELCCGVSQVSPASSRLPNQLPALFLFLTSSTSTSTSTTGGKSFFKHWTNPTQCRRWWRAQQISRSGIWKMGAVPCQRCAGCQCEKSIAVRWSVVVGRASGMIRLNCIQSDFTTCAMHY